MSSKTIEAKEGIDKRTIRAASESMAIDPYAGGPGDFDVYAESGEVYRVDLIGGSGSCPAAEYQDGACKHLRRVEMELGQRPVPDLDRKTDVERMIESRDDNAGAHADDDADDTEVMADGGMAVESSEIDEDGQQPGYSVHYEPIDQGGKKYVRCEGCGRELLSDLGGRRDLPHREGCPNYQE